MRTRLLSSRPAIVTLALGALLVLYWVWSAWAGTYKLTEDEIAIAVERSGTPGRMDIGVILPFAPEQFHFLLLQDVGQMAGTNDRTVNLRGVSVAHARALARNYWIEDIVAMTPP